MIYYQLSSLDRLSTLMTDRASAVNKLAEVGCLLALEHLKRDFNADIHLYENLTKLLIQDPDEQDRSEFNNNPQYFYNIKYMFRTIVSDEDLIILDEGVCASYAEEGQEDESILDIQQVIHNRTLGSEFESILERLAQLAVYEIQHQTGYGIPSALVDVLFETISKKFLKILFLVSDRLGAFSLDHDLENPISYRTSMSIDGSDMISIRTLELSNQTDESYLNAIDLATVLIAKERSFFEKSIITVGLLVRPAHRAEPDGTFDEVQILDVSTVNSFSLTGIRRSTDRITCFITVDGVIPFNSKLIPQFETQLFPDVQNLFDNPQSAIVLSDVAIVGGSGTGKSTLIRDLVNQIAKGCTFYQVLSQSNDLVLSDPQVIKSISIYRIIITESYEPLPLEASDTVNVSIREFNLLFSRLADIFSVMEIVREELRDDSINIIIMDSVTSVIDGSWTARFAESSATRKGGISSNARKDLLLLSSLIEDLPRTLALFTINSDGEELTPYVYNTTSGAVSQCISLRQEFSPEPGRYRLRHTPGFVSFEGLSSIRKRSF